MNVKGNLLELFENWYKDKTVAAHKALPSFVIWGLWLTRNSMIFQGSEISLVQVCHQIRFAYEGAWKPENLKPPPRILKRHKSIKTRPGVSSTVHVKEP
jgi:hypothetical protein